MLDDLEKTSELLAVANNQHESYDDFTKLCYEYEQEVLRKQGKKKVQYPSKELFDATLAMIEKEWNSRNL